MSTTVLVYLIFEAYSHLKISSSDSPVQTRLDGRFAQNASFRPPFCNFDCLNEVARVLKVTKLLKNAPDVPRQAETAQQTGFSINTFV